VLWTGDLAGGLLLFAGVFLPARTREAIRIAMAQLLRKESIWCFPGLFIINWLLIGADRRMKIRLKLH
jgi:hypothetical protein